MDVDRTLRLLWSVAQQLSGAGTGSGISSEVSMLPRQRWFHDFLSLVVRDERYADVPVVLQVSHTLSLDVM